MNSKIKKTLQFLLPVALSVVLLWVLFKKVDFRETLRIMSHGVDYGWILTAMGISVFSHIFRAMRWRIQLNALHVKTTLVDLTCSIFGCYALNLVLPRLGELWRCSFVAHRYRAPFTTVMGSMVADRLADTIMVLALTLLTFLVASSALASFMASYPAGEGLLKILYSPVTWAVAAAFIGIVWFMMHRFRHSLTVKKLKQWISETWKGFAVVLTMPGKWEFLLLTLAIWGCYFIQLYVAMFAFDFTRELCHQPGMAAGFLPCLVAFVLSSIGMAVPSNGGLGPWNIAIMFGFAIYGIADVEGAAFSILQWSGQTVMLIILGIFTTLWIATSQKKQNNRLT